MSEASRHYFYTPSRQSVRNLTGFKVPTDDDDDVIPAEELEENTHPEPPAILEDHEPYHDDDDDVGQIFREDAAPPTMKPMSVSTGDDYGYRDDDAAHRKACFAAALSVFFLIVGYFIAHGHDQDSHNISPVSGSNLHTLNGNHAHQPDPGKHIISACALERLDAGYYNKLLYVVEHYNETELCNKELPVENCKCRNPFKAEVPNNKPGWLDVMDKNIDLIENNYTDRGLQPEVVIYGDSITERLIGRQFGLENEHPEHAKVTEELMTKRGGGHINGLPLGIAGDQMANLLYRLKSGEMPGNLIPRVWWLLIGTNDIGYGCSVETVAAGVIRIVKQIREQHNNQDGHKTLTPVVINSILPRGEYDLNLDQSTYRIIKRINRKLECYAELTAGVDFVNSTDILTETLDDGAYLKEGYFESDNLHPSAEGSRQWEEQIISNVMQYMT